MALFSTNQIKKYRYSIASCIVNAGGELITLRPMNVGGMMILDDYITNVFPIFRLNLVIESDTYYKIMKNKANVKVKLTINKYYAVENENGEVVEKSPYSRWLDDTFCILPDEMEMDRDSDLDILEDNTNADTGDDNIYDTHAELYLYREEIANGMKKRLNKILVDTTMSSVVTWALSESGIKNCIMSPLENGTKYDRLLVPPIAINKLLTHLDAMYGFYKQGSIIYFGIKRSYILNFKGGCTAWESGEKTDTVFLIPRDSTTNSTRAGGTVDKGDTKNYIYWEYKNITFSNPSIIDNVTQGTDVMVVERSSATISKSEGKAVTRGDNANTTIVDNTTENPWIGTTMTAQTTSRSTVLTGTIVNEDIDALMPNKNFSLILEDQTIANQYKGSYRIMKATHQFINDSATGDFGVITALELRRVEATTATSVSMT